MDLLDLLKTAGAESGLKAISSQLGVNSSDAGKLISALSPAMTRGLERQAESTNGMAGLVKALQTGGHQRYLENPDLFGQQDTRNDGNKILGHLFGSKDVSRNVAAHASKETGLDAGMIKKALPLVASLVMGAMSKSSDSGRALESSQSSLGGLGALAGLLGGNSKGSGIGDVMNLARKLF